MEKVKAEHNNEKEFNIFIANFVFPKADILFSRGPESLDSIKENCVIVLDTNVLLLPFTTGKESLDQINETFKLLVKNGRLIIPGQVAREFVKNRATKLAEVYQQLSRKMDQIPQLQKGRYPLLDSLEAYQKVLLLEKEIDEKIREYRKSLKDVLEHVRSWIWNDPVSKIYSDLFNPNTIFDPSFDFAEVQKNLEIQQLHKLPPGYKDAEKDDKGIGDVLVWLTILEIGKLQKKDVLFITGEEKADWWYRSERQTLYPRYELVDEFRRVSDGKFFHMISFSDFLGLFGASKKVVEEIRQKEEISQSGDNDLNLMMANYRMKIEVRLRQLATLHGMTQTRVSPYQLINYLVKSGAIPQAFEEDYNAIGRILSYGTHGEPVTNFEADTVKLHAPKLIAFLDELILQNNNKTQEGISSETSKS